MRKVNLKAGVIGVVVGAFLGFSASANAAVFDFAAIADGDVSGTNWTDGGEGSWASIADAAVLTVGGISVVGTAGGTANHAYFDSGSAGLGACTDLTGSSQCTPSSDDNVQATESLTLDFSSTASTVIIKELTFKDANHNAFDGTVFINGVGYNVVAGLLSGLSLTSLTKMFTFTITGLGSGDKEFYINTLTAAVPVPAALPLFGTGLGLIGYLGWRRKRQAAKA